MHERRRRRTPDDGPPPEIVATWTKADQERHLRERRRATPVAEMGLSVRVVNALEAIGVILAGALYDLSKEDVANVGNFGAKTVAEIAEALATLGLPRPDLAAAARSEARKARARAKARSRSERRG